MDELSKEWFELRDHQRRKFCRAVWVPVYGTVKTLERGRFPEVGHVEETLAVGSAVVFNDQREKAEELHWHHWRPDGSIPFLRADGQYFAAESFYGYDDGNIGLVLVLTQYLNSAHPRQVLLNQDFVMAYGLIEEGNFWLRPNEGYEQVVRLTRNDEGVVIFVEIRTEYLMDYLAARSASLRLYTYRQRLAVLQNHPEFEWPDDGSLVSKDHDTLEVRCSEINAEGFRPGETWAVFKAWRTDVDPEEDVPDFSGDDDEATETASRSGTGSAENIRFRVSGEMWRGEWIEPAEGSFRIGYSEPEETLMVQPDGGGKKVDLKKLHFEEVGKYLWFQPTLIGDLLSHRGSKLSWYTHDTAGVSARPDGSTHFGVNRLGLVNAYAYDVARLPLWERRIWAAHNCRPDGGVSEELMQAQMACNPADTKSPEAMLHFSINLLGEVFEHKFGASLFREHHEVEELSLRIHRFRAVDENGLRSLAKDVVKFTIERINKKSLVAALGEGKSNHGTLKLLQALLAKYTDEEYAYRRMSPLFGAYDLRGADAHLSSSDVEDSYKRAGVDRSSPLVKQAEQLIDSVASAFIIAGIELKKHAPEQDS